jgi:putative ABC transport system permease protein
MIRHLLKLVWNRKRTNALLIVEIFFCFMVVFAVLTAGITLSTRWALGASTLDGPRGGVGFDWQNVWNVRLEIPHRDSSDEANAESREGVLRLMREIQTLPEVESVAGSMTPPYTMSTISGAWAVDKHNIDIVFDDVTDGFAETMHLRVARGRWFRPDDDAAGYRPVVLDQNAARALYPNQDPIGKAFDPDIEHVPPMRVVGIVEPYRKDGEFSAPVNMVFRRTATNGAYGAVPWNFVLRMRPGTPAEFEETLMRRMHAVSPEITFRVRKLEQIRRRALAFRIAPAAFGAVVALFLISMVGLGLTGVIWQDVTKRTRELGLRRAAGASAAAIIRQVAGESALIATIAVGVGSLIVAQLPLLGIFSLVTPIAYAVGFVAALAAIYSLTILCALYPSWMASRLQPADALRYE